METGTPGKADARLGGKPGGRPGTLVGGLGDELDRGTGEEEGGLCGASLGDGDSRGFFAGGWLAGERASAGLTLMVPISGLVGGLLLVLCSTSGLLLRFSGASGVFGLLTSDKGSEEEVSALADGDLDGDTFTLSETPFC